MKVDIQDEFNEYESIYNERKNIFFQNINKNFFISDKERQRFVNNAIIEQSSKDLASQYLCSICENLAHIPLVCQKCENTLCCQICYKDWKVSSKSYCPNCNQNQLEPQSLLKQSLTVRDQLLMVKCFLSDCILKDKIMKVGELINHMEECLLSKKVFKCPQDCGENITSRKQSEDHFEQCNESLLKCQYCRSIYQRKKWKDHQEICDGSIIKCAHCNQDIQRVEMQNHVIKNCADYEISCQFCNIFGIKRKNLLYHHQNNCQEMQVQCKKCWAQFKRKHEIKHDCIVYLLQKIEQIQMQNEEKDTRNYNQVQKYLNQKKRYDEILYEMPEQKLQEILKDEKERLIKDAYEKEKEQIMQEQRKSEIFIKKQEEEIKKKKKQKFYDDQLAEMRQICRQGKIRNCPHGDRKLEKVQKDENQEPRFCTVCDDCANKHVRYNQYQTEYYDCKSYYACNPKCCPLFIICSKCIKKK